MFCFLPFSSRTPTGAFMIEGLVGQIDFFQNSNMCVCVLNIFIEI